MNHCLVELQNCVGSNVSMIQDVFTKLHNIGVYWSQLEGQIIEKFREDVEKLSIEKKYEDYME